MTEDSHQSKAGKILSRLSNKLPVAYLLVAVTLLGSIAGFTDTVEKLHTFVVKYMEKPDTNRPKSLWVSLDKQTVKDRTSTTLSRPAQAGDYVYVTKPIYIVVADPLPLEVPLVSGSRPARKLPSRDFYGTFIPAGAYELLDVDVISLTDSYAVSPQCDEQVESKCHTETWGRIENLAVFGKQ
ncbi:hypothetical protein ACMYQ1_09950 [Shewanella oncorhynchi]|uniref:hypothetical protein n=1 Tax=Shewanella oncorhynchi TaxID=2726434 RepID=UPI0039EE6444